MPQPALDPDRVAALVDRAREIAVKVASADAVEIRGDARVDLRATVRNGEPAGRRENLSEALGVRVFVAGHAAYVHTTDPRAETLRELVERGARLARAQGRRGWRPNAVEKEPVTLRRASYQPDVGGHPAAASPEETHRLLQAACESARALDPSIEAQANFGARSAVTVFTDSLGSWVRVGSLVSTMFVTALVQGEGRAGNGTARAAGERGLGDYVGSASPEALGRLAVERAREQLRAVSIPAGRYRVLCDNELAGTLAHESFGHLTECDLVASGWSTLRGRRGEKLAVDGVSIADAPVVPGRQGVAVPLDEQGTPGRKVTLLDRGTLRSWMHTRESALEHGDEPAGNGRALDARFPPIVRMRNTFFEPGDATLPEALEALGDGAYLVGARGGAPHSDGSFMFTSIRGYLVEKGEIKAPLRTASIHGNVLDFLQGVEMVTRDFEVTTNYFGGCGKFDQSFMHVGVGGPHVLVRDALLGAA